MIAALYVDAGGAYCGLPEVELWGEARDARLYPGPWPVVAHPPCARWCRLAGLVEARWGHKRGEDGGCFAAALASVRRWGGVLEHPAYSAAWATHGLPAPLAQGWIRCLCGGWTCHVEQGNYGHRARKATWLYAYGIRPEDLPSLRWGPASSDARWPVQWRDGAWRRAQRAMIGRTHREQPRGEYDDRPRLNKREASATPPEFQAVLLAMARSARGQAR